MRTQYLSGMFDRAKVLLGSRNNFTDVGNHASAVGTVRTVKLLDKVEIAKMLSVKDNVVSTADFLDAVNRKASQLVKTDKQVGNQ